MADTEKQIEEYLSSFDDKIKLLAQQIREYLREETQPAYEIVVDTYHSLNIGYGFTEKPWDCYCTIVVYNNHISINFPFGASLNDPAQILIGTGSKIRHIRVFKFQDIQAADVVKLISDARKIAYDSIEKHKEDYEPIYSIVKEISGRKNR